MTCSEHVELTCSEHVELTCTELVEVTKWYGVNFKSRISELEN